MRNAGLIQDYHYLTTGFDKYLLDQLAITGKELAQERFNALLAGIAEKRGVPIEQLPKVTKGVDAIDLDEERL